MSAINSQCLTQKKGKGKGQVKGPGGNSVGKGAGKAKIQTEVPSRQGVAEPSPEGHERVVRLQAALDAMGNTEGPEVREGLRKAKQAVSLDRSGNVSIDVRSLFAEQRSVSGQTKHWKKLQADASLVRELRDGLFAAKSVLSRREKTTNGVAPRELWELRRENEQLRRFRDEHSQCSRNSAIVQEVRFDRRGPMANEDGCWPLQKDSDPHEDRLCQIWSSEASEWVRIAIPEHPNVAEHGE